MEQTSTSEKLHTFIEASKAKGAADDFLVNLLREQGWAAKDIYAALGRYYQSLTGLPVPVRQNSSVLRRSDDVAGGTGQVHVQTGPSFPRRGIAARRPCRHPLVESYRNGAVVFWLMEGRIDRGSGEYTFEGAGDLVYPGAPITLKVF